MQGRRTPGFGFEFRVELGCNEVRMVLQFSDLHPGSAFGPACELPSGLLDPRDVVRIHFVSVPVPLGDEGLATVQLAGL